MINEGAVTKFFLKDNFISIFIVKCRLPNFRFKKGRNICDVAHALMILKRNNAKKEPDSYFSMV